jgi:hypothetical protein
MSVVEFPIYRAEALTAALQTGAAQVPRATLRLPSNVPYVVDNLWEFLRPAHMPSRRHALYASPTRALAKENRSGRDQGQGFCVYRLVVEGDALLAHLRIKDARNHADIKAVQRHLQSVAQQMADASADEKPCLSLLFLPGASRADWECARAASPLAAQLMDVLSAASTFWSEAASTPDPDCDGELFLQLLPGATYQAADIESY